MNEEVIWQFGDQETTDHAVHEAGHAVVGRLIEEVSIVLDKTIGYKGYCRFSAFVKSSNDHNEWQQANKSLDGVALQAV